jgi:(p)ppGpp synthase/HD superfamily hydrolase
VTARRRIRGLVERLPKTRAALAYAEQQHAGQLRSADGAPFILHPLEVATLLYDVGAPDHVIAAGVLHDTIEKTSADAAELRARFGSPIATLVLAVSEDPRISGYRARKAALRQQVATAGHDALMVFAADKISKARELRLKAPPAAQSPQKPKASMPRQRRLTHYHHCLELVEELLTDSPLVAQLRTELENLASTPGTPRYLPGRPERLRQLADPAFAVRGLEMRQESRSAGHAATVPRDFDLTINDE